MTLSKKVANRPKIQKLKGNNFPLFFPVKIFIYPVKIMTVMNGRMNGKKSQVKPEELIVNELIQAIESGQTKLWRKEWTKTWQR